jgi:hypothetical protein
MLLNGSRYLSSTGVLHFVQNDPHNIYKNALGKLCTGCEVEVAIGFS